MVESIKVIISMIKKKVTVSLFGQMVDYTKACGKMENSMVQVNIKEVMEN